MTRSWKARAVAWSAATLAIGLVACDAGGLDEAPSAECRETGAQCQLPEGPLGVCERRICPTGATPPCFTCTPQH